MEKQFSASFDSTVKILSVLVFLILGAATYAVLSTPSLSVPFKIVVVAAIWLLFVFCYLLAPNGYVIDKHNLMALAKKHFIFSWLRKEISTVRIVGKEEIKWTFRVFGVGGLFGYYGLFYNSNIGWMIWYASQRNNYVLVELQNGKKVILTPDNPEEFIAALK